MDAIIVSLLIVCVICYACYKRSFSTAVYGIALIDIFLRVVNFIIYHYFRGTTNSFFNRMPGSILALLDKYLNGFVYDLLAFVFIVIMLFFIFYTACIFIKKK